ncbi:MAG: hypothetical protein AB7O30_12505 [Dehalococcoidia bacterium]
MGAFPLLQSCGAINGEPGTTSIASATPLFTVDSSAESPDRPVIRAPGRSWIGRPATIVCVEDLTGGVAVLDVDALGAMLRAALDPLSPIPVVVASGCPFDFPEGPIVSHDTVNLFTYQVYISDSREPRASILEHWLPPGTDSATPVTFRLDIPSSAIANQAQLSAWLESHVGPEPFSTGID